VRQGWDHFIGRNGGFVGMSSFGASAPYKTLYEHFGITVDAIVTEARRILDTLPSDEA
jgi:transketolase